MGTIKRLYLVVQTRAVARGGSSDNLRLFLNGNEIAQFGVPPGPGQSGVRHADVDIGDDVFVGNEVTLGISGENAWAPRAALLFGTRETDQQTDYVPLAHNLEMDHF